MGDVVTCVLKVVRENELKEGVTPQQVLAGEVKETEESEESEESEEEEKEEEKEEKKVEKVEKETKVEVVEKKNTLRKRRKEKKHFAPKEEIAPRAEVTAVVEEKKKNQYVLAILFAFIVFLSAFVGYKVLSK